MLELKLYGLPGAQYIFNTSKDWDVELQDCKKYGNKALSEYFDTVV